MGIGSVEIYSPRYRLRMMYELRVACIGIGSVEIYSLGIGIG